MNWYFSGRVNADLYAVVTDLANDNTNGILTIPNHDHLPFLSAQN